MCIRSRVIHSLSFISPSAPGFPFLPLKSLLRPVFNLPSTLSAVLTLAAFGNIRPVALAARRRPFGLSLAFLFGIVKAVDGVALLSQPKQVLNQSPLAPVASWSGAVFLAQDDSLHPLQLIESNDGDDNCLFHLSKPRTRLALVFVIFVHILQLGAIVNLAERFQPVDDATSLKHESLANPTLLIS